MDQALERLVRERAGDACEYCRLPRFASELVHPIDHIIARQHGGTSTPDNLALSCLRCNAHKGPNVAGIDPECGQPIRLFHPRSDRWADHFEWHGAALVGRTASGRTTLQVLSINAPAAIAIRKALIGAELFLP